MALEPLAGLRVVDLFAGSGALGIEALSRGAAFADLVEPEFEARRVLERNLAALDLGERSRVWRVSLPGGLRAIGSALAEAHLVLADPPYGGREARAILTALGESERLRAGTRVVLEHHAKDEIPESAGALAQVRRKKYGETMVTTFMVAGDSPRADQETPP